MPTLTRWFLRAAMVHLVAAFALALYLALPGSLAYAGPWRPVWIHLLVLGWATQMIFGVAYWMFPRLTPLDLKAVPWLGWICFGALNAGLVVRSFAEPALATHRSALAVQASVAAALLHLAAMVAFVVMTWPRVRGR